MLAALSQQRALILILDDLHWADSASLNLLFHLARQVADSRVLIVGTYRPDDVALGRLSTTSGRVERHPFEPILNEIRRYAGDVVIDLGAAQLAEGRALVDALVDAEPNRLDAAFRQELFARTEGHPLFTVELLRTLEERGDLVKDASGRWVQAAIAGLGDPSRPRGRGDCGTSRATDGRSARDADHRQRDGPRFRRPGHRPGAGCA